MSAKKKKNVSLWSICDYCNVVISQKDGNTHREKNCPPDLQNRSHPFILQETLYSTLSFFHFDDKSLELISKEERRNFILLPCHVLQLCKIAIGDPVTVKISGLNDIISIVKKVWIKQDTAADFSLSISSEVAELYDLEAKQAVIVTKIEQKFPVANAVIVDCLSDTFSFSKKSLLMRIQEENLDKMFCIGNRVCIRYYGNKIILEIKEIELHSGSKITDDSFCYISSDTVWKFAEIKDDTQKSSNYFCNLGGLDSTIEELKDSLSIALSKKAESFMSGIQINKGILIHGPSGSGKTTLLKAASQYFTENIIEIECAKVLSKVMGETEKEIQSFFEKAKKLSPCIILIDDIDVFCAKSNSSSDFEKRIVATLCTEMDKLNEKGDLLVAVLGATSKIYQVDKMLRSPGRFGKEIEIHVPGCTQRFEILKLIFGNINHSLNDFQIKSIADSSHGYVGADLVSLVSKAVLKNYKNHEGSENVTFRDFEWALSRVKPSAMKEIMLDVPNVRWEDIGGQDELKLKLRQCVEWPLKYKDSFLKLGITPPKGVLLFGPPGCSKTMIAKALATESKLNFLSVKGPELFSKWVGESEKAVRKVFRRARQSAPSIVFFDEIDAIGGERNLSSGSNVQERVLAQLLTELDGVESLDNVTVIAATNRLDRIDPALIRPGRLDRIIYVPLPDRKTRKEIFKLQLNKTRVSDDVLIDELVDKTEGYSGAEIIAVVREASLKALEENLNAETVKSSHFEAAFNIVLPRTPKSLLDLYDKYLLK